MIAGSGRVLILRESILSLIFTEEMDAVGTG
jgi:hypothetical protein